MRFRKRSKKVVEVDEIFLDSSNLPLFNTGRMEGRKELPISSTSIYGVLVVTLLIISLFTYRLIDLQVFSGEEYLTIAMNNSIDKTTIIAERGVVFDRTGEKVVWNEYDFSGERDFPMRAYTNRLGMGQLIGYVSYPQKDRFGIFYRTEYLGRTGIELAFNELLSGENGSRVRDVNARGDIAGEYTVIPPTPGTELHLSIDAELSEAMYQIILESADEAGFRSGAGAIMDVKTGELLALTSFPSYDPNVMANGGNSELINEYNNNDRLPFLNKAVSGVYTPGSVVKPFVAYAALAENVISPSKQIISTGQIVIPNPYHPGNPSIFRDWRAHGVMTMREAIAFSSNVYFYEIGGGFHDQPGLGITRLAKYYRLFGFGSPTGINIASEQDGVVPDPDWKRETFDDDWRLGDTYFTAIGQYGFLASPMQILRAYAALANGGKMLTPHVEQGKVAEDTDLKLNPDYLQVIHEGMRKTVILDGGTARGLQLKEVAIAAKSGTAEIGSGNAYVNSWVAGFWPYEDPQYAFVLMMDRAPRSNSLGASTIMGKVFRWMVEHKPEYVGLSKKIDETKKL